MKWDVKSFVGAGPISFGMSPQAVGGILDQVFPNKRSLNNWDGSIRESRSLDCPIFQYERNALNHIDIAYDVPEVSFHGLDVFNVGSAHFLRKMYDQAKVAYVGIGLVIFPTIGINSSGFFGEKTISIIDRGPDRQDNRGIGVFEKGAFDAYLPDYRVISFE